MWEEVYWDCFGVLKIKFRRVLKNPGKSGPKRIKGDGFGYKFFTRGCPLPAGRCWPSAPEGSPSSGRLLAPRSGRKGNTTPSECAKPPARSGTAACCQKWAPRHPPWYLREQLVYRSSCKRPRLTQGYEPCLHFRYQRGVSPR